MKRILIADDEPFNRDVIRKVLSKEGMKVLEAANGQEALTILETETVSLILMDLMMPVMDGFEAIETVRGSRGFDAVPLIALTALNDRASLERALRLGADACIVKPYDLPVLVRTVRNAVEGGRDALGHDDMGVMH